jgi:murein tripeptide amidase MpaA
VELEIYQALALELAVVVEQVLLERLEQQTHLVMVAQVWHRLLLALALTMRVEAVLEVVVLLKHQAVLVAAATDHKMQQQALLVQLTQVAVVVVVALLATAALAALA